MTTALEGSIHLLARRHHSAADTVILPLDDEYDADSRSSRPAGGLKQEHIDYFETCLFSAEGQ